MQSIEDRKPPINELVSRMLPLIQPLGRGDSISVEALEAIARDKMERWDQALRQWFMRKGIKIYRRDGRYHLMTDEQQSYQPATRQEQAKRAIGRGMVEGNAVNIANLAPEDASRYQHQMRVIVASGETMAAQERRMRFIKESAPKGLYPPK